MSARPSKPLDGAAFSARAKEGASACAPGVLCGMLSTALDEGERGATSSAGLVRYFSLNGETGVSYRTRKGGVLLVLNQCPWCGKSPWKAASRKAGDR